MKNNHKSGGPLGFLKQEYYQSWANYHVKFLNAYAEHNISFWAISTGNEPMSGIIGLPIPAVGWIAFTQKQWVQNNLGPAIRKSAHSKIKLLALDGQRYLLPSYIEIMFESKKVKDYIDGIAVHWYGDNISPSFSLTFTHEQFPEKPILATEASIGVYQKQKVSLGNWERGERYVHSIIQDIENFVTGWVDWNMVLNLEGGPTVYNNPLDAPIIINGTGGEFYKQPMFYAMGHFSKFVHPGSRRIQTQRYSEDVLVAGFLRPDKIKVLVIMNKSSKKRNLTIRNVGSMNKINLTLSRSSFTTILF
ncbi:unnamed protein product [Acanthoscelides obtectus]|uniref:Glucosylceramidase n=2 Tax=Acanthoscelides obtectus TaxID=200917 RepID=A0A9P0MKR7_ACAOB|nr:unnamed protein product [Acanthoscelides obtectus]CAK1640419.1 Glucosylceramidase [Acanthoscelides obtectus]